MCALVEKRYDRLVDFSASCLRREAAARIFDFGVAARRLIGATRREAGTDPGRGWLTGGFLYAEVVEDDASPRKVGANTFRRRW